MKSIFHKFFKKKLKKHGEKIFWSVLLFVILCPLAYMPIRKSNIDLEIKTTALSLLFDSGYTFQVDNTYESVDIIYFDELELNTDSGLVTINADELISFQSVTIQSIEFRDDATIDFQINDGSSSIVIDSSFVNMTVILDDNSEYGQTIESFLNGMILRNPIEIYGFRGLEFRFTSREEQVFEIENVEFSEISFNNDRLTTNNVDYMAPNNSGIISGGIEFTGLDKEITRLKKSEFLFLELDEGYSSSIQVKNNLISGFFNLNVSELKLNKGINTINLKPSILEWLYLNLNWKILIIVFVGLLYFTNEILGKSNS